MKGMQLGDIEETFADIDLLKSWIDYEPKTSLEKSMISFAKGIQIILIPIITEVHKNSFFN